MKPAVMLQAFYKRGKYVAVPCPADKSGPDWWWDHLAEQAHSMASAGFTSVWLPPVTKAAQGVSAAALGYSVFDDYDIGSKYQKATVPTRYGTREQLARCVAVMRANGIDVYLDLQLNHRKGGSGPGNMTFRYRDSFGNPEGGRFQKDAQCFHTPFPPDPLPPDFHPDIPQDPNVPLGESELRPPYKQYFGPDLAHINGKPAGYVFDGLVANVEWLSRALDVQGYRIDHVPGISTDFLRPLLNQGPMEGKYAVAEYFTGDLAKLRAWISNPQGMNNRCSAFDFPLWGTLIQMCNHPNNFDMASLDHAGLAGVDPFHAVTFVENHDTESRPDIIPEHITRNKPLAYAYILTAEGLPCVFYKDYSTDPGCLGLKPIIDNLIWIRENMAEGPTQQRWKDTGVFAFERMDGPHLIVGLNKDEAAPRTITVDTGFPPGAILHDYSGHVGDIKTDGAGRATITIPRNLSGLGYICYSRSGIERSYVSTPQAVTQVFEGAHDLDIKPADNEGTVTVCRVWVASGSTIEGVLNFDSTGWMAETQISLTMEDPSGNQVFTKVYTAADEGGIIKTSANEEGWHRFGIRSHATPTANQKPAYNLTLTYSAPPASSLL